LRPKVLKHQGEATNCLSTYEVSATIRFSVSRLNLKHSMGVKIHDSHLGLAVML